MNIDSTNAHNQLPEIIHSLKNTSFIAFDLEFTGLTINSQELEHPLGDYHQFYQKMKENAANFNILQIGLTLFHFNEPTQMYIPKSYNIYVKPTNSQRNVTKITHDVAVSMVSSLTFLAEHGMDLTRVYKYGLIPERIKFHTEQNQQQVDIPEKYQNQAIKGEDSEEEGLVFYSQADRNIISLIQKSIETTVNVKHGIKINFQKKIIFNYCKENVIKSGRKVYFDKNSKLEKFEYLVRIQDKDKKNNKNQYAGKEKNGKQLHTKQEKNPKVQQKKQKKKQQKEQNEQNEQKEKSVRSENELKSLPKRQKVKQNKIGEEQGQKWSECTKVAQKNYLCELMHEILKQKIPLVGYYLSFDLGLLYSTFISDLPETFEEFVGKVNQHFQFIFDTKIISLAVRDRFKGACFNLKEVYSHCFNPKILQPFTNINYQFVQEYIQKSSSHEAGYDSFMTGVGFVGMVNCLLNITEHNRKAIPYEKLSEHNKILNSRYTGEIQMLKLPYSLNDNSTKILIVSRKKAQCNWMQIAKMLTKYGTLTVHEYRNEVYFVFDERLTEEKYEEIVEKEQKYGLKKYKKRRIIRMMNLMKVLSKFDKQ